MDEVKLLAFKIGICMTVTLADGCLIVYENGLTRNKTSF